VLELRRHCHREGEAMSEHYPKNTISAAVWCNKCGKETEHRIDDGRRGPCLVCMAKPVEARKPQAAVQSEMFR
jgi:hypothetical protein